MADRGREQRVRAALLDIPRAQRVVIHHVLETAATAAAPKRGIVDGGLAAAPVLTRFRFRLLPPEEHDDVRADEGPDDESAQHEGVHAPRRSPFLVVDLSSRAVAELSVERCESWFGRWATAALHLNGAGA